MRSLTTVEVDKRELDLISRDVMSSEPAVGDKPNSLDVSDTDDEDGCVEQVGGTGAGGDTVKNGRAKCPHNHQRNQWKQCGGSVI